MSSQAEDKLTAIISVGVLVLLGLTALTWFRDGADAVTGYDFATSLRPADDLTRSLYLWDERLYAGYPNVLGVGTMPYFLIQYAFERAAGSLYRGQMLFFTLLLMLPGLSMYWFARTVFGDLKEKNSVSIISALFYMFNTFVVVKWNRGELLTLFSYGMVPLYLALIERGLKGPLTPLYLTGFACSFFFYPATLGHSADFVIVTALTGSYFLWRALWGEGRAGRLKRGAFLMATALLTGAWWIIPLGYAMGSGVATVSSFTNDNLGLVNYYSSWAALINIMKMWFFSMYPTMVEFSTQFYRPGTLLFPIIAFSALLMRRNRHVLFFSSVALIGLWFSKGTHGPLPGIYEWMYTNIPYFFIFRAPSRYFPVVYVLSLAVLTGYAGGLALAYLKDRFNGSWASTAAAVTVFLLIFFHSWPIFSRDTVFRTAKGDTLYPSVFVDLPSYYEDLDAWFKARGEYFRVHSFNNQTYLNYTWGYSSTDIAPKLIEAPQTLKFSQELVFGGQGFHTLLSDLDERFWRWDFAPAPEALGLLGVRYITVVDDVLRRYLPDTNYREILSGVLDDLPGISKAASFGPADVYENEAALPHVYAVAKAKGVFGGAPSLLDLAGTGYLKRPALIIHDSKENRFDLTPPGSIDEFLFVESAFDDAVCDSFSGDPVYSRGEGTPGIYLEVPGEYLIWARKKDPGPGDGNMDSAAGESGPDAGKGIGHGSGSQWLLLGTVNTLESGRYAAFGKGPYVEYLAVPKGAYEERSKRLIEIIDSSVPRVTHVRRLSPSDEAVFKVYSPGGPYKTAYRELPRFEKRKRTGHREDYGEFEKRRWARLERGTIMEGQTSGGVRVYSNKTPESLRVRKKLLYERAIDLEEFPYSTVVGESSPAGYFDVDLSLGIDFDGDGWADGDVTMPSLKGDHPAGEMPISNLLKEKFGYPGKPFYRAVEAVFTIRKNKEAPALKPGERPSFTIKGIEFYRYEPQRVSTSGGSSVKVTVDGEKPSGKTANLSKGNHSVRIANEGAAGAGEIGAVISTGWENDSGEKDFSGAALPELSVRKIDPTKYEVAVKGAEGPFWLLFNEAYHNEWKAYVNGAGHEKGGWSSKGEGGELKVHRVINGYANGWWVDGFARGTEGKKDVRDKGEGEGIKSGAGDFTIVLYFAPQRAFERGRLVSICASVAVILYMPLYLIILKKRPKEAS